MLRTLISGVFVSLLLAFAAPAQGATVYTLATNLFSSDPYTVTSFTFDEGTGVGTILKTFDTSSDDLFSAVALGTHIDWLTITQFDNHPDDPMQVAVFNFANVMFTSFQGGAPEEITFQGELVPEPSALSLLLLGAGAIAFRARLRRRS